MKKWAIFAAAAVTLAIFAVPAHAAKNNGKGGGRATTAAVDSTIKVDQASPRFGDVLTFTTTGSVDGARIWLHCSQDGDMVYQVSSPEESSFTLGGGAWTGSAALCTAELHYYIYKGQTQVDMVWLAKTEFDVAA